MPRDPLNRQSDRLGDIERKGRATDDEMIDGLMADVERARDEHHQVLVNYHHMVDVAQGYRAALEELRTTGNGTERNRIIDATLRGPCPACNGTRTIPPVDYDDPDYPCEACS